MHPCRDASRWTKGLLVGAGLWSVVTLHLVLTRFESMIVHATPAGLFAPNVPEVVSFAWA
jgi:hypothetical protein